MTDATHEESNESLPVEQLTESGEQLDDAGQLKDENFELIMDIPVTVSVEIGRSSISVKNLLQLHKGSIVELDKAAGEPMDVRINGTLIAKGDVVVVDDKFGIRLKDVVNQTDRLKDIET